jgi:hypothetical protein
MLIGTTMAPLSIGERAHHLMGMWRAILKRVVAILALTAFLGGALSQGVPHAMAAPSCAAMTTSADNDCGHAKASPGCVVMVQCVAPGTLPSNPVSIILASIPARYWTELLALEGRAVEPDLSPPITVL